MLVEVPIAAPVEIDTTAETVVVIPKRQTIRLTEAQRQGYLQRQRDIKRMSTAEARRELMEKLEEQKLVSRDPKKITCNLKNLTQNKMGYTQKKLKETLAMMHA